MTHVRRRAVCELRLGRQAEDGDPRASFTLLEPANGDVRVTIERVDYDAEAVAAAMRRVGLPDELADKLPHAA